MSRLPFLPVFAAGLPRVVCAIFLFFCCFGSSPLLAQAPGTVDPVFGGASLGLSGNVYTVAVQSDGKVLVGGEFGNGLVRLNADGSTDTGFNAQTTSYVDALALQPDGKIVAGGEMYYDVDGSTRNALVRLNADGSLDTSFSAYTDFGVDGLTLQPDGKVLVTGGFGQINGVSQSYFARLNTDGSLDTGFQVSTGNSVEALVLQPDGRIVIGGRFLQINGVSRNAVARLNADGSLDTSFQADCDSIVEALALQPDGKIVAAGDFAQVDGTAQNYLARLNADGSLDTGFRPTLDNNAYALALQPDGGIIVGGNFANVDSVGHNGLARLKTDGSLDTGFQAYTDGGYLHALVLQPDGKVIIGGQFSAVDGAGTGPVVRLAADGEIDHFFNADEASGPNAAVMALALQPDGKLVIGGLFTQVNGAAHVGIARLNTNASPDTGFQGVSGANGFKSVSALALQPDGKVVVGSGFNPTAIVDQIGITRLNADGSPDAGFHAGITVPYLSTLALQPDGKIVISGTAYDANGDTYPVLARLNADGSEDSGFLPYIDDDNNEAEFLTFALQPDGKVLVGGDFYFYINGFTYTSVARLNADGSLDMSFQASTDADGEVDALAVQPDGRVIIGGSFSEVDGVSRRGLARLNTDGSLDTGFQPGIDQDSVNALAVQPDGKIVTGGFFSYSVNGVSHSGLARLNADGSLDPFFNPGGSGPNKYVNTLAIQPDGKIFVGGYFTSINGVLRNYVARLNGGGAPDFFNAGVPVGGGFYYEQFPGGTPFGYYNLSGNGYAFPYFFHADLGLEYFFDANDGDGGAYLFDFASGGFFYTSPVFPWPYLYDFSLNTVLYYYPDPTNPGRYNTNGYRFFYRFDTGQVIVK